MTSVVESVATDYWLLPLLRELLSQSAIDQIESDPKETYWRTAVEIGLLTDDDILDLVSSRTHCRIATDLVASSPACEAVPEKLARKFGILPLSISESILDVATANPYDIDCEKTLAFATARTVRMSLAPLTRIMERIEEVYSPVARVSKL